MPFKVSEGSTYQDQTTKADIVFIDASKYEVDELEAYDIIYMGFLKAAQEDYLINDYFEVQIWTDLYS